MANTLIASNRATSSNTNATRPFRYFNVTLRFADQSLTYTTTARSSSEAVCEAIERVAHVHGPVSVTAKSISATEYASKVWQRKMALAHLVESGVGHE